MRSTRFSLRGFWFAALAAAILIACSKSNDAVTIAKLGSGCLIDSDCNAPLVCAFKTCHEQCSTDDAGSSPDCPANQLCVASDRPYHVCQAITTCALNSDCPTPLVCGRDLECRDQCSSARDCVVGQGCIDGTCVAPSDPHDVDGSLVSPIGTISDGSSNGVTCRYNTECPLPLLCVGGLCSPECLSTRDCVDGLTCVDGMCVGTSIDAGMTTMIDAGSDAPAAMDASGDATMMMTTDASGSMDAMTSNVPDGAPDGYSAPCIHNSDCGSSLVCLSSQCVYACINNFDCDTTHGQCCGSLHTCVTGSACAAATDAGSASDASSGGDSGKPCEDSAQCQDGLFCNGAEQCLAGFCRPAAAGGCDDGDPCTNDSCTEASRTCMHIATGPIDADNDGHFSSACGGDDCDDTNANVYPGHPEICDQIDNNCDGLADEGLWANGATVTIPGLGNSNSIPPVIVKLTSGPHAGDLVMASAGGTGDIAVIVDPSLANVVPVVNVGTSGVCAISTIATSGPGFALSTGYCGSNQNVFVGDGSLGNVGGTTLTGSTNGSGTIAWDAPENAYAAVWPDSRNSDGANHVYGGFVTQAGLLSNVHELSSDTTQDKTSFAVISAGPSNALIAFNYAPSNDVRYGIIDSHLTLFQPPGLSDLTQPEDKGVGTGPFDLAGSYVFQTLDASSVHGRLRTVDATTGVVTATLTYTNPVGTNFGWMTPIGNAGIGVLMSHGGALRFGFAPLALNKAVAFTEVGSTNAGTIYGSFATIDAKHVALAWIYAGNATVYATTLTCSP